jgi:hypothetical protein
MPAEELYHLGVRLNQAIKEAREVTQRAAQ